MTPYSIALFFHVVGALGLFIAISLEWVSLAQLRRADTAEHARDWLGMYALVRWVGPVSLAAILLPGIYLTVTAWGGAGWIITGFVAMLLLPPLGASNGLRLAAVQRDLVGESGRLTPSLRQRLHHPLYLASIQIRTAIALGIVFLMTNKPDVTGSVIAITAAILLGLAFSLPALNHRRVESQAA